MGKCYKTFVIFLLLISILFSTSAVAIDSDPPAPPDDPTDFVYLSYVTASIASSSGKAICNSRASATNSCQIYMTVSLQKQIASGTWTTVKSWSTSGVGTCRLEKQWNVVSGYYYRNYTSVSVYTSSGSFVESAYAISPSKYI